VGGEFYRLTGSERARFGIYYVCAIEFGWDQRTVDAQDSKYIKKLLAVLKEERDKENRAMSARQSKQVKKFM
jgi:hypothetical protein